MNCAHPCVLVTGTEWLAIMAHNFHSHAIHKMLQDFFLGYVCSLTEYNYGHHGSNCSWHHARELILNFTSMMMCRHIGVVGLDVRLSDLEQILFSQQWGSLYSFVTNEEGRVIIHPRLTPAAEVE